MSSSAKAAVIVVVAFVAGLFVGIAGDRALLIYTGRLFPRHAPGFAAHRVVEHLDHELHLTAAQRAQVQQIIEQHRARIDAAWNNARPQVQREMQQTHAEIDRVLTPEQRAKLQDMQSRADRHRRRMGGGPPPF